MTDTNDLRTFDFSGLELRVIMHMSEPWFVARDVCQLLGIYQRSKRGYSELHTAQLRKAMDERDITLSQAGGKGGRGLLSVSESGYLLNEQARDTAHADDRQAMPLPEEFAQLFAKVLQQQAETNQLLAKLLAEREADRKEVKAEKDVLLITAATAKARFGLTGV